MVSSRKALCLEDKMRRRIFECEILLKEIQNCGGGVAFDAVEETRRVRAEIFAEDRK